MYLFFDTETTGIPDNHKAPASDLKNWPRLVQIAWLLSEEEGNEVLKPDGLVVPMDAARIHGITTELARRNGAALASVLIAAAAAINKASVLVLLSFTVTGLNDCVILKVDIQVWLVICASPTRVNDLGNRRDVRRVLLNQLLDGV